MPNEMIRLPDGSLVMRNLPVANVDYGTMARFADLDPSTGQLMSRPPAIPGRGFGDFLKEKLAGVLPQRLDAKPAPWWIPKAQATPAAQAMPPVPQNIQQGRIDPFKEIESETNKEEALAKELGDFSRRVMSSPELIEGRWLGGGKK